MAWFRPAGDREHPGDPPPEWAPMGKAGRLVLVITVIVGVVIALLLVSSRTAGAADVADGPTTPESAAPPSFGQRVEVSEAGFAVTFPIDWEVSIDTSDVPGEGGTFAVVSGREAASDVTCEVYLYGPCTGSLFGDCAAALDEVAARMVAYFEGDESSSRTDESTSMDLPAGYAVRVDTEWMDEGVFGSSYLLTDGKVHDSLLCRGSERPEDRWLSIAESFEFLPAEE